MSAVEFTRKFEIERRGGGERHQWYLLGPRGVVQFKAGPDISQNIAAMYPETHTWIDGIAWTGWDLGYHSPRPTYDGHEPITESCEFLDGMACYYDGTGIGASELLAEWGVGACDDEIIWRTLAERYEDWLCSPEETCASPMTALGVALKRATS